MSGTIMLPPGTPKKLVKPPRAPPKWRNKPQSLSSFVAGVVNAGEGMLPKLYLGFDGVAAAIGGGSPAVGDIGGSPAAGDGVAGGGVEPAGGT